jgi:hypothetical protein
VHGNLALHLSVDTVFLLTHYSPSDRSEFSVIVSGQFAEGREQLHFGSIRLAPVAGLTEPVRASGLSVLLW